MATPNISLKLLVDTKNHRVLFAEAGKDFVDSLFSLIRLPLGTVIALLTKPMMVGSLGNLYASIEDLSETYLLSSHLKESILKTRVPLTAIEHPLLTCNDEDDEDDEDYVDNGDDKDDEESEDLVDSEDYEESSNPESADDYTGFVKDVITYMVMDDLEVKPISTISSITILNKFNVQEVGALEERVVEVEMAEALKLLKASLQSKTVLTNVFLGNKAA